MIKGICEGFDLGGDRTLDGLIVHNLILFFKVNMICVKFNMSKTKACPSFKELEQN